jgi:hypothetical protein
MKSTSCLWLMLLCASMQPALIQAQEDRRAPLTLANLPASVHSQCGSKHTLRIALVGCAPDLLDERLRSGEDPHFRLIVPPRSGEFKPSRGDTELVVWLRSARTRMAVWAVPFDRADPGSLIDDLDRAVNLWIEAGPNAAGKPAVLLVPQSIVSAALPESPKLRQILAGCWQVGCLPIAVGDDGGDGGTTPGMVAVSLTTEKEIKASNVAKPQDWKNHPVSLSLRKEWLTGGPDALTGDGKAVIAYLSLLSAALPVREMPVVLERACLLGLVSPVFKSGTTGRFFRVINPAVPPPGDGPSFFLIDQVFKWDEKVNDDRGMNSIASMFQAPDEVQRRILAGIRGQTPLRHLAAMEELTGLQMITLARLGADGWGTFRTDAVPAAGSLERAFSILSTQKMSGQNPHLPLTSLSGDVQIQLRAAKLQIGAAKRN